MSAVLTVGLVVVLSVVGIQSVSAHNALLSTTPATGTTVTVMPSSVVLHFDLPSGRIGTAVTVTGPDGDIATGPPQMVDTDVRQPVTAGSPAGRYSVNWRVVSADGHPVHGSFTFTTTHQAPGVAPSAHTVPAAITPTTSRSGLAVLVLAAVAGLAAVAFLLRAFTHRWRT